jgi:hypothetical protein
MRDDSGVKVKILGGDSIGHCEEKKSLCECYVSNCGAG